MRMKTRAAMALVLGAISSGFVSTPAYGFIPSSGTYYGLFFQTTGYWVQSSGTMKINTTSRGTYSANLQIGKARYSFSGRLASDGSASVQILRYYQYPLTVQFQVTDADPDVIVGTVSDGYWTAQLNADRAVFDGKTNISPNAGHYTMVLHGDFNSTQVPGGASFGTITINKAGRINFAASLADGTTFTQSTAVSKNGRWPLYAPLYSGNGTFYGWMLFNASTNTDISGDVTWVKPQMPWTQYYPYGFYVVNPVYGSRYIKPPKGMSVLNFTDATIQFNGQNLYQGITNNVFLTSNNQIENESPNGLNSSFSLSNGRFSGHVMDPITFQWYPFKGVVVQNFNIATGYFSAWNLTGEVWLQGD